MATANVELTTGKKLTREEKLDTLARLSGMGREFFIEKILGKSEADADFFLDEAIFYYESETLLDDIRSGKETLTLISGPDRELPL